jgi:hypothetical protein
MRGIAPSVERISIGLTNRCAKACWFCYAQSTSAGSTLWTDDEIVAFVLDCALYGVKAVSFGGGEPLEYPGLAGVLERLSGRVFRSFTTNGLLLEGAMLERIAEAKPDKVHVSVHFAHEAERAIAQVRALEAAGIRSGVNLLVPRSRIDAVAEAARLIRSSGIGNDRIVYLPMRMMDTPTPEEVARVAGGGPFQSMSCLALCAPSPRFCSISWDKKVAWCSYTDRRHELLEPTHAALDRALVGLGLDFCGGTDDRLVRLPRRALDGQRMVRGGS